MTTYTIKFETEDGKQVETTVPTLNGHLLTTDVNGDTRFCGLLVLAIDEA